LLLRSIYFGDTVTRAGEKLFNDSVHNVMRRPTSFFDTTPSGQIMNRLIKDISDIDVTLPDIMGFFLIVFSSFLATFIVLVIVSPIHLVIVFLFFMICHIFIKKYMATDTDIKRLKKIAFSPVLSSASEVVEGGAVLRQFKMENYVYDKMEENSDLYVTTLAHEYIGNLWLTIRIKHMTSIVITLGVLSVAINKDFRILWVQDADTIGLMLSYVVQLTLITGLFIWTSSALYATFSSVERIQEYILYDEHEKSWNSPSKPENWPNLG
jgi:ABC-type multidrug transport system fused ATPase/permease subunit